MPITKSLTARSSVQKSQSPIHTANWHQCWEEVQGKGHTPSEAAAICTASLGYDGSVLKSRRQKRNIPQSVRDKMPDSDFAGPHESFPIKTQADVDAAEHLVGHAEDPGAVKSRIIAIAKRKGLSLPDAWKEEASKSEFTRVLKFNANHDDKGRFSFAKAAMGAITSIMLGSKKLPEIIEKKPETTSTPAGKHTLLDVMERISLGSKTIPPVSSAPPAPSPTTHPSFLNVMERISLGSKSLRAV